ncbi:hypothetical protein LINGRAHAP2_LOCUS21219 [Linum grandiflorum]
MPGGSAAADGLFRNWAFDSSLSGIDYGIERRPYHRNCKCALHDKSRRGDGNSFGRSCGGNCRNNAVSYKIRRSFSEGSLALSASANGSGSGVGSSPACSINSSPNPAVVLARSMSRDDLSSAGNDGGLIR